jgi:hypothetical protein
MPTMSAQPAMTSAVLPTPAGLGGRVDYALLALIFCLGFFGYLMPALGYFTMIPGDLGDARFNSVILEHGYQWLTGQAPRLWSPDFFYPFERVLGLSDNHFGSVWSYAILRGLGLTREMAYSGWFLVGTVLNFWVCWWVLKREGFAVVAAGAGAFVFAFALPMLHQEGHAQMVYRFAVPLAVFAAYRGLVHKDVAALAQAVFWCGVQFLCSIYLGVFLVYALAAGLLAYGVVHVVAGCPNRTALRWDLAKGSLVNWIWVGLAVIVGIAVILLLRQYHQVASDYGVVRPLDDLRALLPRPSSYLLADNSQLTRWVGSEVVPFAERPEHQMFVGIGVLVLVGIGCVGIALGQTLSAYLRKLACVSALTLALIIALTLLVKDFSAYYWLLNLPGVAAVRAVSRIILVMLLPIAVLVAVGVEWLRGRSAQSSIVQAILMLAACLLLAAETVYYQPKHYSVHAWVDRQDALRLVFKTPLADDAILYVTKRKSEPFYITEIDAMIYAQDHHLRTLNGYSGSTPAGYAYPDPCLPPDTRLKGYFAFRNVPEARQQTLLSQLKTVALEPCAKN